MSQESDTKETTNEPVTIPVQRKTFIQKLDGFFKWCSVFSEWFGLFGEIHKKHFNE